MIHLSFRLYFLRTFRLFDISVDGSLFDFRYRTKGLSPFKSLLFHNIIIVDSNGLLAALQLRLEKVLDEVPGRGVIDHPIPALTGFFPPINCSRYGLHVSAEGLECLILFTDQGEDFYLLFNDLSYPLWL